MPRMVFALINMTGILIRKYQGGRAKDGLTILSVAEPGGVLIAAFTSKF